MDVDGSTGTFEVEYNDKKGKCMTVDQTNTVWRHVKAAK